MSERKETKVLADAAAYIESTYAGHYAGDIAPIDYMESSLGTEAVVHFIKCSIDKYVARQGKKAGEERKDLMKIIHYSVLLAHYAGKLSWPSQDEKDGPCRMI